MWHHMKLETTFERFIFKPKNEFENRYNMKKQGIMWGIIVPEGKRSHLIYTHRNSMLRGTGKIKLTDQLEDSGSCRIMW